MTALVLSLADVRATSLQLRVTAGGAWVAYVDVDADAALSGAVVLRVGGAELRGMVDVARSGRFGLSARYCVVAGADGWRKTVKPRGYHNDAGVKRSRVLTDLARDVGEALTISAAVDATRLGVDFARQSAPASRVLAQAAPGVPWWVGFDGTTVVGPRLQQEPGAGVELLEYDPRARIARVALDSPAALVPGTVVRDRRLAAPLEVREVDFEATAGALRASAWVREVAS